MYRPTHHLLAHHSPVVSYGLRYRRLVKGCSSYMFLTTHEPLIEIRCARKQRHLARIRLITYAEMAYFDSPVEVVTEHTICVQDKLHWGY